MPDMYCQLRCPTSIATLDAGGQVGVFDPLPAPALRPVDPARISVQDAAAC